MSAELIKYIAEQSGGVLIAIILINHVESKLDLLTAEITRLTDTLTASLHCNEPAHDLPKSRH